MKLRNLLCGLVILALSLSAFPQANLTTPITNRLSYSVGVFNAAAYNWSATVFNGSAGTGAYTITLYAPAVTLSDGRRVAVFGNTTIPPITIGSGANIETVTPSSVSGCASVNLGVASQGTCQITATFTYSHGRGDVIASGDAGVQEAINDAANNGGGQVYYTCDTGIITLATGATTTTYSQGATGVPGGFPATCPTTLMPAGSYIWGVAARVTTAITSACTGWELGDGTTAARWTANNTGLTAGTSAVNSGNAWSSAIASTTTGIQVTAAKGLVITCAGGNPGAGAIKARIWGYIPVAPGF